MYRGILEVGKIGLEADHEIGLTRPFYKIYTPETVGNFKEQWISCLHQLIQETFTEGLQPIRVNIFVLSENQADYLSQHELIHTTLLKAFDQKCPPFGVVMQEPEDPYKVICEVGFVNDSNCRVNYGFYKDRPYCVVDAKNHKEYWTIGTQAVHPDFNIMTTSIDAISNLKGLYDHLGISFNNIVRQWNYVGEILKKEKEDHGFRQHYQMFNEVRSNFYRQFRTRNDFPAATGIGMLYSGVCIDSFAVSGNENLVVVSISNPSQSESYKYSQKVLVGTPNKKMNQNQPPQFERAKLITLNKVSRLLISGTASIIVQDTIGIDNIEEQTKVTIQNIRRLSEPENIKRHYPEIKAIPINFSYIRVYVKYKKDIAKVKDICIQNFGDVPATYVVADICRDNLLVEIETELIS